MTVSLWRVISDYTSTALFVHVVMILCITPEHRRTKDQVDSFALLSELDFEHPHPIVNRSIYWGKTSTELEQVYRRCV